MSTLPLTPDELLTTTRSVRKRLDFGRPVPLELVRECLEIALQAPSGSNRQTWHWVVVTDAEQRRAIGDYYRRSVEAYLASDWAAGKLHADDPDRAPVQRRVGDSVAYLGEHLGEAPVLVLPCLQMSRGAPRGGQPGRRVGVPAAGGLELHAGGPGARARHRLDHAAPGLRGRGGRAARAAGRRAPGRADPDRVLHGRHLPPGRRASPSTRSCTSTTGSRWCSESSGALDLR